MISLELNFKILKTSRSATTCTVVLQQFQRTCYSTYCQWIVVQQSVHVYLHVMQCCLIVDEIFEQFEIDDGVIVKAIQQLKLAS